MTSDNNDPEEWRKVDGVNDNKKDLEKEFKDDASDFKIAIVVDMWLTGFDVKNLSTLYLDKPMKSHTLMQAIARANRVYPNKTCGIIVDYVNVFKFMREALKDYAVTDESTELMPVKDIDKLIDNLDSVIDETSKFLKSLGIDLDKVFAESTTFDQLEFLRNSYNTIIEKDTNKERFKVLSNTMINLYDASKPEIFEKGWENDKFAPINYINGLMYNLIDGDKVEKARHKMQQILDSSVTAQDAVDEKEYVIKGSKVIDLTKLDVSDVKKRIKEAPYKAVEVDDLRKFIEELLEQMINRNQNRIKFSERYKSIIDRYNSGGTENEDYYEQLLKLIEDLRKEQERPSLEGLTESELEIYDLLIKGKKLTKAEEQKVKLAAKNLFNKLVQERKSLLVVDWYKDDRTVSIVKNAIQDSLDKDLPESYDKEVFIAKTNLILSLLVDKYVQGLGIVA